MGKKAKRLRKAFSVGDGAICKRCKRKMLRYNHGPMWKPKAKQPYYFTYWDKCSCGMIQLYEKAKVFLERKAVLEE